MIREVRLKSIWVKRGGSFPDKSLNVLEDETMYLNKWVVLLVNVAMLLQIGLNVYLWATPNTCKAVYNDIKHPIKLLTNHHE